MPKLFYNDYDISLICGADGNVGETETEETMTTESNTAGVWQSSKKESE